MAREKVTLTLDKRKASAAKALIGAPSISETVDVALDRMLRTERLRRDVAAYAKEPLDESERSVGEMTVELDLDDDDVDYEALYGKHK